VKYNERKVSEGRAELLDAANFLKEKGRLSLEDKVGRFRRRMELNERVTTNLHITLNFDPLDDLTKEKMQEIARRYMEEIGFSRQPYLVYRHLDAGHPHCHIVTTHVRPNGTPIELYKIGADRSEKARQIIEDEFGLTTAEWKKQTGVRSYVPDGYRPIRYGEGSLTHSMSRIIEYVTESFAYTSLQELNAILGLYNIAAYRGKEGTQLYNNRGLLYRALDEHGKFIGLPIKASFFACRPTLANLEKKFPLNLERKESMRSQARRRAESATEGRRRNMNHFKEILNFDGIKLKWKQDKEGHVTEVLLIDMKLRTVFQGEELCMRCNNTHIQLMIDGHARGLRLGHRQG
jgi:hypothetical protein